MHPNPEGLHQLHELWSEEARQRRFAPSEAVDHYLAALDPESASKRYRQWVIICQQLEAHVSTHGRLPTLRSTQPLPAAKHLVAWARYQRRNFYRLSAYQRARLDLIPGWSWSPAEEAWLNSMQQFEFFVREHGRRPRRRSNDKAEVRLAIWYRNQGRRVRAGAMGADRLAMLKQLQQRMTALNFRR
ncbi:helicase associated domain-containing protein [Microcella sp.]|uniref:helicase associated domain-containing protein n=1 Tax=Microcella sp. TaxID=1913979 RepID=UPI003F6E836A